MATDKALGFMSEPARLLVAITRDLNSLVILANWTGLKENDKRAMRRLAIVRNAMEKKKAYTTIKVDLTALKFRTLEAKINQKVSWLVIDTFSTEFTL
jgi:hypothetical protein